MFKQTAKRGDATRLHEFLNFGFSNLLSLELPTATGFRPLPVSPRLLGPRRGPHHHGAAALSLPPPPDSHRLVEAQPGPHPEVGRPRGEQVPPWGPHPRDHKARNQGRRERSVLRVARQFKKQTTEALLKAGGKESDAYRPAGVRGDRLRR